jgi:glycosyltransferase involved in cell wall biosynthesis
VRILCLTHNYPRRDGDLAGAFIERLMAALVLRGHTVDVVTPSDAGQGGTESRAGVTIHRFRYAPAAWETLAHTGAAAAALRSPIGLAAFGALVAAQARAALRVARSTATDIVHAHWWVPGGASAWLASRTAGALPYVVTLHGTDVALLGRSSMARALSRRILRAAAGVTAVSGHLADRAAGAAGLDRQSLVVQPMPFDAEGMGRTSHGGAGVVTVGRLTEQKRVGLVLEALAVLKGRGRTLPFTVVGDGPERQRLEAQAARLGLGTQVRFAGTVAPSRIAEAVGDADVFAFTAVGEGYGLAAAEALALGVPVVTTDAGGGVLDVVPRSGAGRIVPDGDVPALARALEEVASTPACRDLAAAEGARLKRELSADAVARRFEAVYERALSGRARV